MAYIISEQGKQFNYLLLIQEIVDIQKVEFQEVCSSTISKVK